MVRTRVGMSLLPWSLAWVVGCPSAPDPLGPEEEPTVVDGTVQRRALRRLNRHEIRRSVQDLLGVRIDVSKDFPVDDASHGFDTVAEGLTVSPLWVELVEHAASLAVSELLDEPIDAPIDVRLEAEGEAFENTDAYAGLRDGSQGLYSGGSVVGEITVPEAGTYRISALVWGHQAGPDEVQMALVVGAGLGEVFDVSGQGVAAASWIAVEKPLVVGRHRVEVDFLNDYFGDDGDRNAFVDAIRVEGPIPFVPRENPAWDRTMSCDPKDAADPRACVADLVADVASRAWRRPLAAGELDALMALYDDVEAEGDPPIWGLEFALRAVLTSPHFLFIMEPEAPVGTGRVALDDHALAARLSYLLWSSLPDRELRELADEGSLHEPAVLKAQVARMLDDERAMALAEDFGSQWLMVRAVDDASPDFYTYPSFTEDLRASMKTSMTLQFSDLVFDGAPVTDLLLSRTAWLDTQLAALYGLRGVRPDGFERLDVGDYGRRGWLTTAGLLTATSYPTRTSPVRRGVWVLSQLLCEEPEPPPAGVEGFPEPSPDVQTVRDRLAAHRVNPSCAGCHNDIDPLGLAFEGFGGIGIARDYDAGVPIDATGELPDGTVVDGVVELAEVLANDPRFTRCAVEKVFTYGQGRAPSEVDRPFLDAIHSGFLAEGGSFESLLTRFVLSDVFRTQEARP